MTHLEGDSSQLETEWATIIGETSDPFDDPTDEWLPDSFLSSFSPNLRYNILCIYNKESCI